MRFFRFFLSVTVLLILAAQPPTDDLDLDFRGGKFRESLLTYVGKDAPKFIKKETEGLRITIPSAEKPLPQMGISSKLAVHGDFEITLSYEILAVDKPTTGYGAGINMTVIADSQDKDSATIARRSHPKQGEVYATNRAFKTPTGEDKNSTVMSKTTVSKGKLRLSRAGSVLVFSAAGPEDKDFSELRSVEFVDLPLRIVRVTGDVGKSASEVDVRIHTLQIHSRDLTSGQIAPATRGSWTWLIVVAVGLCSTGVAAFFGWRFYRKRLDAEDEPPKKIVKRVKPSRAPESD